MRSQIVFRGWLLVCLGMLLLGGVIAAQPTAAAPTPGPCSGPYSINERLPNGTGWSMCWEERDDEGLVLYNIRFLPSATGSRTQSKLVMNQLNLAQIFVPYDDNSARFHDLSDYGLGGTNMNNMTAADCPQGTLLTNNGRNVVCKTVRSTGYGYKSYTNQRQANTLELYSVAHIGAYNYIVQYTFGDDGSIKPAIGATGRLQLYTSNPQYGWNLGTRYGTSHGHSYYWRMDFDLEGAANDALEQMDFSGGQTLQRPMTLTTFPQETSAQVSNTTFRGWRIKDTAINNTDGHAISYELLPDASHISRGPASEPWTGYDVYYTQYNACEKWASHNSTAGGCGNNVAAFNTNETVTDAVLWYGLSFHHVARDEDEPYMSTHWSSFDLVPRDLLAVNLR